MKHKTKKIFISLLLTVALVFGTAISASASTTKAIPDINRSFDLSSNYWTYIATSNTGINLTLVIRVETATVDSFGVRVPVYLEMLPQTGETPIWTTTLSGDGTPYHLYCGPDVYRVRVKPQVGTGFGIAGILAGK